MNFSHIISEASGSRSHLNLLEVLLNRKAFTLIELLVVIAIIAILAAILFPVFAQAKAAAKKIASVSNNKQLELAGLMYSNDVDDMTAPATAWDTGNSYPISFGTGSFANWSYLEAPYIKTAALYFSPQNGTQPKFVFGSSNDALLNADLWPDYGYNYVYMSPWNGTAQVPISQTSADQPAATITLAERGSALQSSAPPPTVWGFSGGFTPTNDAPLLSDTVEVPVCNPIPAVCVSNWALTPPAFPPTSRPMPTVATRVAWRFMPVPKELSRSWMVT